MKIDRRNFIQLMVGGVAGLHLTPLPWKLTDDIAIWTQNWPWVPVPHAGRFNHAKTICNLCPGGCGIEVRKVDSRAVKIEGRTDFPVNPGGLCPVGMGGLQLLYNESIRFPHPMKRVGPRGAGKFQNITWDEALQTLAGHMAQLRSEGGAERLAAVDGNPRHSTMALMVARLLEALGSPNYLRIPTSEDTNRIAAHLMMGSDWPVSYDLENSDFVLSFGCGLLEGWGAPGRVLNAWGIWRSQSNNNAKIVQIESRASNTASKADRWIAPIPGTETALALGMAHVIVKEGLYSRKFVDDMSTGFYDSSGKGFKELVLSEYSPARVSDITGLNAKEITGLARSFAGAKAPVALCGKGKGALSGDVYEYMAILALNALVGNINKPGGVIVNNPLPLSPLPPVTKDDTALNGLKNKRLDRAGTKENPFTPSLINNLAEAVLGSKNSPVDTLLVFSANPGYTLPDGGAFKKALEKIPYIVSFSPYRDETSSMADLILPDHTYLEKRDDFIWQSALQYPMYAISSPAVKPVYDTRNTGDVIIELARLIGGTVADSFDWKQYEEVLAYRAKGLADKGGRVGYKDSDPAWNWQKTGSGSPFKSFEAMWKKAKESGFWFKPLGDEITKGRPVFKTPSSKFEFLSSRLAKQLDQRKRGAALPHYEEALPGKKGEEYPLRLLPCEMLNLASGWIVTPPFLTKTLLDTQLKKDESFVEINPETAARFKLRQDDRAKLTTPAGKAVVRVNLFEGAMPGVVYMPLGMGHSAYDEFMKNKGVNANELIAPGKDPVSGYPVWWNTPVKIKKA